MKCYLSESCYGGWAGWAGAGRLALARSIIEAQPSHMVGFIGAIRAEGRGAQARDGEGRGRRALHFNCIVSCNEQVISRGINGRDNVTRLVASRFHPPTPRRPAPAPLSCASCHDPMFIFSVHCEHRHPPLLLSALRLIGLLCLSPGVMSQKEEYSSCNEMGIESLLQ